MKINSKLFTLILTVVGSLFLIINLKKNYFDSIWDYFFSLQIFILNSIEFNKYLKEIKNLKKTSNEKIK